MTRKQSEILMTLVYLFVQDFSLYWKRHSVWTFYDHIIYYMKTNIYAVSRIKTSKKI